MLTKDIGLVESILDLVDNSIDSLIRRNELQVMDLLEGSVDDSIRKIVKDAKISIKCSDNEFEIKDNCGGITVNEAANFVFRFGEPPKEIKKEFKTTGLSVYGIGMKRAFFKIGRLITLTSIANRTKFEVNIDVDKWEKTKPWDFEFSYIKELSKNNSYDNGTVIRISRLNQNIGERFILDSFQNELREKIETTYALFLMLGMKISINDLEAEPKLPRISKSEEIGYVRKSFTFDSVDILLIAGLSPRSDRIPRGWYIFCNGRMILEANRDKRTGWGVDFPFFHPKYNHFVGMVYFRSQDVDALPWTTTKDGLEVDSEVYQFALEKMHLNTKPIINFLNALYPSDISEEGVAEKDAYTKTSDAELVTLPKKDSKFIYVRKRAKLPPTTTISYKKRKSEVDLLKECIGRPTMSNKELGKITFQYYMEMECE